MAAYPVDTSWMWHPSFTESQKDTAGLFVHFRRAFVIELLPQEPFRIHITADTRYKLYINHQCVAAGPVKGDSNLWFYDEIDITPYLRVGQNHIGVHVLRFFHATSFATSFPRLPIGGLMIKPVGTGEEIWKAHVRGSTSWETAIDGSVTLPTDSPEDHFLHIYEKWERREGRKLEWVAASLHEFAISTGQEPPWHLSPRMIPHMLHRVSYFAALHNIRSSVSEEDLGLRLTGTLDHAQLKGEVCFHAGTEHHVELEMEHHTTAFVRFRFKRPAKSGGILKITYAESYEKPPPVVPWLRSKNNRRDSSLALYGPQDVYTFEGMENISELCYHDDDVTEEIFAPFHFRTFRFIALDIVAGSSDLTLKDVQVEMVNYPLEVQASFQVGSTVKGSDQHWTEQLWSTSIRTLRNCMHDCYEDCPFYEQLQYAMDTRSSALFTYYASADDRLARQAMTQIANSFQHAKGLTHSRAPAHHPQYIPHFSLFWISTLSDHFSFFGDAVFIRQFVPIIDAVLEFFNFRLDRDIGLVRAETTTSWIWDFVDWTAAWRPYGVPPAVARTGFNTYTNCLYAYTLRNSARLLLAMGTRTAVAQEYLGRADSIVAALRKHCFDGTFFTDGLALQADPLHDYSQHNQVWAVLSGAAVPGTTARDMLRQCLVPDPPNHHHYHTTQSTTTVTAAASGASAGAGGIPTRNFTKTSISMSFYTLRALSAVQGSLYDDLFPSFWIPWRDQLALGLTTWEEDTVSHRSDCHAWGSAPIYEFMAEVAGVRPVEPGWGVMEFQPRVSLYKEFEGRVPFVMGAGDGGGGGGGGATAVVKTGIAHVKWFTKVDGDVEVSLILDGVDDASDIPPIHVMLPLQNKRIIRGRKEMTFVIKGGGGGMDTTTTAPGDVAMHVVTVAS